MVSPYQSPVERLYAGEGVRMNAHHTDPRFLAAAFSIPDSLKIHGRTQKYILRKACAGLISDSILATRKTFNRLKHDTHMSDVLDRMADDLLAPALVRDRGLFDPAYVTLLLTELWARTFIDRRGEAPSTPPPPVRHLDSPSEPHPAADAERVEAHS
jgi:hypothetical protein